MIDYEPASFKDPAARVFYHDGWVCRRLNSETAALFRSQDTRALLTALERDGKIFPTTLVPASDLGLEERDIGPFVLAQPLTSLVTYSYEWSFEMLRDAALVTLDVLDRALRHGYTLKDGNSFNVLFDRCVPKLADVPSIERYKSGAVWSGYSQFCRGFLFPLLLASYRGIDVQLLLRGGLGEICAEDTSRLLSMRDILKPGVLKDVMLQARFDRTFAGKQPSVRAATAAISYPQTAFVALIARLHRLIAGLHPPSTRGGWLDYDVTNSYARIDREKKAAFVRRVLSGAGSARVVDLGCNTGAYSLVALESGSEVIALDGAAGAIDRLYRSALPDARLSPLVADILNPTPAMGWRLQERQPLFKRIAAARFLALGLIHHIRISGGVPLAQILEQLFEIGGEGVIEWVDKADPMVQRMLSLRADVFDDYSWSEFERLVRMRADILAVVQIHGGTRRLYHVRSHTVGHA